MKPFNLEAAKRGEPIFSHTGYNVTFIGVKRDGSIVVEADSSAVWIVSADSLSMTPRKRIAWVNFYEYGLCEYFYSEIDADAASRSRLGDKAYPVEINE